MKYFSLLILLVLLYSSWNLAQSPSTITQGTHSSIQSDLKTMITEYIQQHLPNSKNLKFERLWTEMTKENQLKATFHYSFDDPGEDSLEDMTSARVTIEGYAILNRTEQKDPSAESDLWSLDELNILNNEIRFEEGSTIRVDPDSEL